jgi:hypothetical protein
MDGLAGAAKPLSSVYVWGNCSEELQLCTLGNKGVIKHIELMIISEQ